MNKVEIGDRVVLTPRWVAGLAQTLRRLGMDSDVSRIQGIQGTVTAVRGSFGSNRVSVWVLFDNASDGIAIPYPRRLSGRSGRTSGPTVTTGPRPARPGDLPGSMI